MWLAQNASSQSISSRAICERRGARRCVAPVRRICAYSPVRVSRHILCSFMALNVRQGYFGYKPTRGRLYRTMVSANHTFVWTDWMLATLLTGADAGNGPISYLGGLIHRHTSVLFTLGVGRVTLQVKGCLRTRDRLSAALVVRTGPIACTLKSFPLLTTTRLFVSLTRS